MINTQAVHNHDNTLAKGKFFMKTVNKSQNLIFNIEKPLIFNWTGKFEAPSSEWSHLTRTLYDYELMFVTSGTLYIEADKSKYEISEGEYIIMPPLVKQQGWKPSDCSFYWLHFAQNEGEVMFYNEDCASEEYRICANGQIRTRYLFIPMTGTLPFPERFIILFKQLQDAEKRYRNKSYDDFFVTSILLELKSQLMPHPNDNPESQSKDRLCDDIKAYINWHISEPVTVSGIADYYGYNSRYLTTVFKEHTGTSIKNYILNEKMEQAKALLTDTNNTIAQIGYSIGFQDNHNFSTCFKKITGLTPSDYRNEFNKNMIFHQ